MVPVPFEVLGKRQDTVDTWTLELSSRSGEALDFTPGQFNMLAAAGAGEVPISISGDPDRPEPLVHTVRSVGLATAAICRTEPGQVLSVRGPFGGPWPVEEVQSCDVVIAAGGIGLAPLRPAVLSMLARREQYGRLVLMYGGRSPDHLLYAGDRQEWAARGFEVLVTVDTAGPEWIGHVGVVTRLARRTEIDWAAAAAMLCGPEVMMRFMVAALLDRGVRAERIYASMERNMQCGIGHCGHCQLGPTLVCRDGAVYRWSELAPWLAIREL
jgi:NAD(P)H-flavin reductase